MGNLHGNTVQFTRLYRKIEINNEKQYFSSTPNILGEAVLNAGHIIMCGKSVKITELVLGFSVGSCL